MNNKFLLDYQRFTPHKYSFFSCLCRLFKNHELRYVYLGRVLERSHGFKAHLVRAILYRYRQKYGLEINFLPGRIGGGLRLVHPWDITVNSNAQLGECVTLYKGATIGVIDFGDKAGNPIVGDNVTVFSNATVCGNIVIGNNVEIAAGAFVNFNVPSDSVVIGNPGIIHKRSH